MSPVPAKSPTPDKSNTGTALITESLAVKYRPYTLDGFTGQDSAITQVKGILNSKRVPRSLLITGMTGSGKTTLARMIARYLNCETTTACGKCASCKMSSLSMEGHPDIDEYNLSDNRGIDDIRAIIASSRNMPRFNYRVYIMDEVHQLTSHGQNAFLKALEEPPSKTIYILVTTNPEKLLPTLVGRCVKLNLKPITENAIGKRLLKIAAAEGVLDTMKQAPDYLKTFKTIIALVNGSMRDAISLFENVVYTLHGCSDVQQVLSDSNLLRQFALSGETDADKAAVATVVAILKRDMHGLVSVLRSVDSPRTLISKTKWLLFNIIDDYVKRDQNRPTSYALRMFKATVAKKQLQVQIPVVIHTLTLTVDCETKFNQGVDEHIALLSTMTRLPVQPS